MNTTKLSFRCGIGMLVLPMQMTFLVRWKSCLTSLSMKKARFSCNLVSAKKTVVSKVKSQSRRTFTCSEKLCRKSMLLSRFVFTLPPTSRLLTKEAHQIRMLSFAVVAYNVRHLLSKKRSTLSGSLNSRCLMWLQVMVSTLRYGTRTLNPKTTFSVKQALFLMIRLLTPTKRILNSSLEQQRSMIRISEVQSRFLLSLTLAYAMQPTVLK
mmetsp:Transcript_15766/g.23612  ORF Transcript_15766/g.23612 Transcript_15766/m.23612 type:complete len:210 (+) Transcript_15766:695-1324(+)